MTEIFHFRGCKGQADRCVKAATELIKSTEQELGLANFLERLQLPDSEAVEWRGSRG
jgi:hypothetical protein